MIDEDYPQGQSGFTYKGNLIVESICKETGKQHRKTYVFEYYAGDHEPTTNVLMSKIMHKVLAEKIEVKA